MIKKMKSQSKIIIILFLLFSIVVITAYSKEKVAEPLLHTPSTGKTIDVKINKNIETLAIVYCLAEGDNFSYAKYTKAKIENYFSDFKNHSAIETVRSTKCWVDILIYPMLYYSSFPEPHKIYELPDDVYRSFNTDDISKAKMIVDSMMTALSKYYKDAKVDDFISQNNDMYNEVLAETKKNLPNKELITLMENYYGKENLSYTIIPSPMLGRSWNFGPRIFTPKGLKLYYVIAPSFIKDDTSLEYGFNNPANISKGSVHEFGHSFINPLAEKYRKTIDQYSYLLKPIKNELTKQGYDNWWTVTHEHIVRTGEIRIAYALKDSARANELREEYVKNRKFLYIPCVEEKFKIYEQNRNKYKSIEDFFPMLLDTFSKIDTTKTSY